jgi:4-hydroxybenzoate polyprenyltransferase
MSPPPESLSNINPTAWLLRHLPIPLRPYARLMRLDKPIGTWLLLIPCWWSVALAQPGVTGLWPAFLFALGAVVMRGAGCVVNDIYDRKLDAEVVRTAARPLASGEIKLWQAVVFIIVLLLIGFGILLLFNRFTVITGITSLALVFTYPLMKRITWWPQLFLGLTFNWGALLGWAAVEGSLGLPAILLYAAGVFWTLGYDTIYAHQDKRDDARIGIKSTALLFDERSRPWVALFYALALFLLGLAGRTTGLGHGFYALLIIAAGFAAVELAKWRMDDPDNCLRRFRHNRDIGLIILAGIILGQFL